MCTVGEWREIERDTHTHTTGCVPRWSVYERNLRMIRRREREKDEKEVEGRGGGGKEGGREGGRERCTLK